MLKSWPGICCIGPSQAPIVRWAICSTHQLTEGARCRRSCGHDFLDLGTARSLLNFMSIVSGGRSWYASRTAGRLHAARDTSKAS